MTTKDILGINRFDNYSKERVGCRGIIIRDSYILLVHELKDDIYMIPGGGCELDETLEECCTRELQEETGYVVKPIEGAFLQINEYYEEYRYVNYYFYNEIIGTAAMSLTEAETERKLITEWVDLREAIIIFSKHNDYAPVCEEKRGVYLREYTALQECFSKLQVRTRGGKYNETFRN